MKKRRMSEAMKPVKYVRTNGRKCRDCPKWKPSYCPIIVVTRAADHPACRYGADLINSRDTAARIRAKAKGGKA